jgi:hypothetical protein
VELLLILPAEAFLHDRCVPVVCYLLIMTCISGIHSSLVATVLLKSFILWDMMPCSPANVAQRFGGTYCLHLQDQKVSQAKSQDEAGSKQSSACFMLFRCLAYSLTLKMQAVCSSKTLPDFQLIELLCNKSEYSLQT